jgi:hypothetical protein
MDEAGRSNRACHSERDERAPSAVPASRSMRRAKCHHASPFLFGAIAAPVATFAAFDTLAEKSSEPNVD